MDTDTRISVIAGRPGAGKTRWAAREVVETLRDVNNVVIYIGFDREFERICRMVSDTYGSKPHGKLLFALQDGAGEAIGKAVDIANNGESRMFLGNEDDNEYQNNRRMVFVFYDQCRRDIFTAGSHVYQRQCGLRIFQIGRRRFPLCFRIIGILPAYRTCTPFVISKSREPRLATQEEIQEKYR